MSDDQAMKLEQVTQLLMQAKQAREEAAGFTKAGAGALQDQVRSLKEVLKKERTENREMKERLSHAYEAASAIRDHHKKLTEKHTREREGWQNLVRQMKDRHEDDMETLRRQMNETSAASTDRIKQMNQFGSKVMKELSTLQSHLQEVNAETQESIGGVDDVERMFIPPVSDSPDNDANGFFITQ
mmetsp:Transcript_537/g.860  ORF Transcript_537/g.860 Transcript_537/m.860 type:complete len:185 (-) Transcript_537:116-670(-)